MSDSVLISVWTVWAAASEGAAAALLEGVSGETAGVGGEVSGAGEVPGAGAGVGGWLAWAPVPVAAVVLGVLAWSGVLSSRALERGPARDIGLTLWDGVIGVWLWLCGVFMGGGLLAGLADLGGGVPAGGVKIDANQPATVLLLQLASFGPPVFWLGWRARRAAGGFREVGLVPRRWAREVLVALVALPVGVLLVMATQGLAYEVASALGDPPPVVQHDFLNAYTDQRDRQQWLTMGLLTFSTVVVAPVCEEIFNRGLLQTALLSWLGAKRRWMIIGIVSLFFAALHVGAVPAAALPALFVLGVLFGWLYERTGSLWPGILVHAGFNGLNVMYVLSAVE